MTANIKVLPPGTPNKRIASGVMHHNKVGIETKKGEQQLPEEQYNITIKLDQDGAAAEQNDDFSGQANVEGLSTEMVNQRREIYGFNEVIPKSLPEWKKLLSRFLGIVPVTMLLTAILSVAIPDNEGTRDWISFSLLTFELLLVVIVDYVSDRNAGNAVKAVKELSAPLCKCKRDGKWHTVKVKELVPGDICALKGGVVIPADGKLVGIGEYILIDESTLTGEALAVAKYPGHDVMAGSLVQSGELDMVVTATGVNTFFGKTLALLGSVTEQGHLRKVLRLVAKIMAATGAVGCFVIFSVKVFRDEEGVAKAVKFAFALLTSVIPVAMPVVTTTVLSVGALQLSKESALVTRLSAIEEMAGIEVLCCDKTGTLTLNQLSLDKNEIVCEENYLPSDVLLMASLASKLENQEPIDKAITEAADLTELSKYKVKRFIPFNPVDKRTEATVVFPDGITRRITKGAPHIIRNMVAEYDPHSMKRMDDIITAQPQPPPPTKSIQLRTFIITFILILYFILHSFDE